MRRYFGLIIIGFLVLQVSCVQNGKLVNGTPAPNLFIPDSSGHKIELVSLKGNLVLVDFWASWCVPCRRENPYLVEVYNEFKDKQFANAKSFIIYSISLDTDRDKWVQAIHKDGLVWPLQVCELDGWKSSAVPTYHIDAIPDNYLLDQDGIIIGRNMRSDDLVKLLSERVKK